jgi:hypothetical protein
MSEINLPIQGLSPMAVSLGQLQTREEPSDSLLGESTRRPERGKDT